MPVKRPQDGQSRGFNISDFRSFRNKAGILRNHDFHIELPFPPSLERDPVMLQIWQNLELTCDSINFPATGAVTYQVQRYSYGVNETKPTIPRFSNLECTFVTDQSANLWRFFHNWLRSAVNYTFLDNPTNTFSMEPYEISYTQEYTVDMWLYIYDPFGTLVRKTGFRQAYPTVIGDIPLAWSAGNQIIRIPVTFAFFDWQDEPVTVQPLQPPAPPQPPTNVGPGLA